MEPLGVVLAMVVAVVVLAAGFLVKRPPRPTTSRRGPVSGPPWGAMTPASDRLGRTLGTVARRDPPVRDHAEIPPEGRGRPAPRRHAPDPARPSGSRATGRGTRIGASPDDAVPARPFADRFAFPPHVRAGIVDADHPADVVRAVLTAGGRRAERRGDLVVHEDVAIVVAPVHGDADAALSRAYLRIRSTGARHGLVIRLGYADPEVVRRHAAAAPDVRHVGPDAIQRMADAVAAGADPLAFALAPSLGRIVPPAP